ncbi:uncharacterized protein LOC111235041 [Seriola dumerili]|uniref:Uncharacterized LOC111235041 n=1 Tax=Seriola dumerili TaxID=41447 RepID=A0A3B4TEF1_SERDU|nr:uncharacterized protein LOC111235041 [Seriola dumerili]
MAASMWRMNGLLRRMAGVLVLCTLLLSNKVICQEDGATNAPAQSTADPSAADPAASDPAIDVSAGPVAAAPDATVAPTVGDAATAAGGADSVPSAVPGDNLFPATIVNIAVDNSQDGETSGTSGTTPAPLGRVNEVPEVAEVPDDSHVVRVVPNVQCVGKEDIPESNAVRAVVVTDDCEATKRIIQENPASWCLTENCNLDIFQDGNNVLVASKEAGLGSLAAALQSEHLKDKLGVTKTETPSSSGSSVFVGVLVSGLLAALGITAGYFKCQRRPDPKGVRLAEEAYPVDQENQGNTLVSVAPLNPPPETQEKPSVNGESPEAAKTQPPPPTNGHSTAKTADTEL